MPPQAIPGIYLGLNETAEVLANDVVTILEEGLMPFMVSP